MITKRINELRHRVTIQSAPEITNRGNQKTYDWDNPVDVVEVWACIESLSGRELIQAQSRHSETTSEVTIRYYSGLTTHHRIKFGSRQFRILAPPLNTKEKNEELVISCVEIEGV